MAAVRGFRGITIVIIMGLGLLVPAHPVPYMHDGRFATLEERYRLLRQRRASKADLVEYMRSLNGEGWGVTPPVTFPQ
jgi:hypothetical protein